MHEAPTLPGSWDQHNPRKVSSAEVSYRRWTMLAPIEFAAMGALHYIADSAFDELLKCWRRHDDFQHQQGATVKDLGRSRADLELARRRMNWLRGAMYPTNDELETTLLTTLCPTLGQVVHLNRSHRDPNDLNMLICICGQQVPTKWPTAGKS